MSSSSNNMNTSTGNVKTIDVHSLSSGSTDQATKRSFDEDESVQKKKIKTEQSSVEQKNAESSGAIGVQPNFVSAAKLATPIPDISDEELLEFVLELERKNGI